MTCVKSSVIFISKKSSLITLYKFNRINIISTYITMAYAILFAHMQQQMWLQQKKKKKKILMSLLYICI